MGQFVIRRIVLAIPTFLIAMVVIFFSIRLIPGDELTALIGEKQGRRGRPCSAEEATGP